MGKGSNLRGSWGGAVPSREDRWGNEKAAGEGWVKGKASGLGGLDGR